MFAQNGQRITWSLIWAMNLWKRLELQRRASTIRCTESRQDNWRWE